MTSRPPEVDRKLLALLDRAFETHAKGADAIDAAAFQRALGMKSEYLAGRVFAAFDANGDGRVTRDELLDGVRALVLGDARQKLAFAFRVHDHDGDGSLSPEELLRMIAVTLAESDVMERATQSPEHLTRALFFAADANKDGKISFDELYAVVAKRPHVLDQMTRNEAMWIAPNEELLAWIDERGAGRRRATLGLEQGVAPIVVVAPILVGLWAVANALLFAFGMLRATSTNVPMRLGHALGLCLDFNGALILIPTMRRLLTRIRRSALGRALPVDDAIDFHKLVGHTLFALGVAHVAAFVLAYASGHASQGVAHVVSTTAGATGAALFVVFAVMWSFSLRFIRRTSRFELFYFTHLLYVAWLALAIAHAPIFLAWAGVPLVGFALERRLRVRRRGPATRVLRSTALRSGVTRLEVTRPPGFRFGAADYVFVRIPAIAKHEWHPFTISSAPEKDTLTFHVRSLGNWTQALRRHAEAREDDPDLVAYVDGPYGSPSAHLFRSRFAVLIGAGIGVTPFASVLESLVLRGNAAIDGSAAREPSLERAYFVWLNRDQYSFEWFRELLADLEARDLRGLLETHLCMTGARAGTTALALELARDVLHTSGRSDIITGLRTHTHFGPPDWERILGGIAERHAPATVDVYFCGPPALGAKLRRISERLRMTFREERF